MTNEKRLAEMVEAVKIWLKAQRIYAGDIEVPVGQPKPEHDITEIELDDSDVNSLRSIFAPFCEEMTDEEIRATAEKMWGSDIKNLSRQIAWFDGVIFYRDRDKK